MEIDNKKDLYTILVALIVVFVIDFLIYGCHEWGNFSGSIFIASFAFISGLLFYLFILSLSFIPFLRKIRERLDHANSLAAAMTIVGVVAAFTFFYSQESSQFQQQKQTLAGAAPVPLVAAKMFDFGDSVVMTAQHQRGNSKPIHVTRVWIKRDGQWLMAFSQQTTIQ